MEFQGEIPYSLKEYRQEFQNYSSKLKDNSTGEVDPNGGSQTFAGQFVDGDVNFFSRDANSGIRPISGNLIGTLSVGSDGSSNDNDFATYVEKVWSWQDSLTPPYILIAKASLTQVTGSMFQWTAKEDGKQILRM